MTVDLRTRNTHKCTFLLCCKVIYCSHAIGYFTFGLKKWYCGFEGVIAAAPLLQLVLVTSPSLKTNTLLVKKKRKPNLLPLCFSSFLFLYSLSTLICISSFPCQIPLTPMFFVCIQYIFLLLTCLLAKPNKKCIGGGGGMSTLTRLC